MAVNGVWPGTVVQAHNPSTQAGAAESPCLKQPEVQAGCRENWDGVPQAPKARAEAVA